MTHEKVIRNKKHIRKDRKIRFEELFKDKIAINHYRNLYNKLIEEIPS